MSDSHALGGGDWVTPERTASADLLWHILGRNLGVALLLFSGAYTAGFSTILALGMLSAYVGATCGAAAGDAGVSDALSSVILYAPLEFAGLLAAATAELTPVFAFVRSSFTEKSTSRPIAGYIAALRPALRRLCYAVILIGVAGAVETIVISIATDSEVGGYMRAEVHDAGIPATTARQGSWAVRPVLHRGGVLHGPGARGERRVLDRGTEGHPAVLYLCTGPGHRRSVLVSQVWVDLERSRKAVLFSSTLMLAAASYVA
jgi:uncharacterized membrane protein SpoIIM required for sporulation